MENFHSDKRNAELDDHPQHENERRHKQPFRSSGLKSIFYNHKLGIKHEIINLPFLKPIKERRTFLECETATPLPLKGCKNFKRHHQHT